MIASTVFALTVLALASVFAKLLGRQQRAHDRRVDLLVNQVCHLAGNDWQPAPAAEPFTPPAAAPEPEGDRLILEEA